MADYIDREELLKLLTEKGNEPPYYHEDEDYYSGIISATIVTESLSSVDAVEVVRCKDCKHIYKEDWCKENNRVVNDDDYCKWGEKE